MYPKWRTSQRPFGRHAYTNLVEDDEYGQEDVIVRNRLLRFFSIAPRDAGGCKLHYSICYSLRIVSFFLQDFDAQFASMLRVHENHRMAARPKTPPKRIPGRWGKNGQWIPGYAFACKFGSIVL